MAAVDAYLGAVLDSRYRLTGVVRSGTTATTYLATRIVDGAPLLVKVLSTLDPTEKELARLRTEAAVGARVAHPGIATPVAVLRTTDGAPFLVYEQPSGEELSLRLKRDGRLSLDATRAIVLQAGDALAAAHRAGVVHGDLRPASIYVDGEGRDVRAQLIDFGIAKLREARIKASPSESSNSPAVIGAVSYMAPEQAHGLPSDTKTDQFSLAALIFEILLGKAPFGTGSSVAILSRVLHAEPPPMMGVPREVERVVLRGLAKRPEARHPSVEAFVQAFNGACGGSPTRSATATTVPPGSTSPTLPPPSHAEPWMRSTRKVPMVTSDGIRIAPVPRRPRPVALGVAAGCALAAALGAGVLVGHHWSTPPAIVAVSIPVVEAPPAPVAPPPLADPAPDTIALEIDVVPSEARVRINDRQVSLPTVHVPRSSEPLSVVVDAASFLPKTIEVTPDSDQKLVVRLVSTAAPTLPTPPRVKPKPAAPEPEDVGGPINDLRNPF